MVLFGGVSDNETLGGESLVSEFYNDLFAFNLENTRWYPIALKGLPAKPGGQGGGASSSGGVAGGSRAASTAVASKSTAAAAAIDTSGFTPGMRELLAAQGEGAQKLHAAATRIQAHYRGYTVRKAYRVYRVGGAVSELLYSPATFGIDLSV